MAEDRASQESLAALTQFFLGDRTVEQTLDRVTELTTQAVLSAEFVGITMMSDGRPRTSVFTDPTAPEIDQAQYDVGEGPCLEAFRTGSVVEVVSTRDDERWRAFNDACVAHGVMSTLSIPLTVDATTHGALNLYATTENAFSAEERTTAGLFGAQAAVVLANAVAYWGARARAEQLEQALHTRGPIEQAKGIIMATMRCGPDEAFEVLVKQSERQNRKPIEIALQIVADASRPR